MSILSQLKIGLAQINTTVGDLEGNLAKTIEWCEKADSAACDLVLFPELVLSGYPPEDLLFKDHFLERCNKSLDRLAREAQKLDLAVAVGYPEWHGPGKPVYNSLAVAHEGRVVGNHRKCLLPNYGVFDEKRYFEAGSEATVVAVKDCKFGLTVCEDIWSERGPALEQSKLGAEVILNCSASPYHQGKSIERLQLFGRSAIAAATPIVFCNAVGGQDELVFDGQSLVIDSNGELVTRAAQFDEQLLLVEIGAGGLCMAESCTELLSQAEEVYSALVLGTRDYVEKNGFDSVLIGVSGGVDSALVLAVAVDALGADHVTAVVMPSPHSSAETQKDAREISKRLGCHLAEIAIADLMSAYNAALKPVFKDLPRDIAEENLQARIRGNILMALSNKFGQLVLVTSNKSESSVGYSTLYGDLAGGFSVLKDVSKTQVYRLIEFRNSSVDKPFPDSVISRPPTAELRPDQLDTDTLPPYELLDQILELYVEQDLSSDQIAAKGFQADLVKQIASAVDRAEYKRRQVPPGIKIRPKAFGRDRRMPITNRFVG